MFKDNTGHVSNTQSIPYLTGFLSSYPRPIFINGVPSQIVSSNNFLPSVFNNHALPLAANVSINLSSINEFQMINSNDNDNSTIKHDSCMLFTRSVIDGKSSFIVKNTEINNCSKPRHVLCKTKSRHSFNFYRHCYRKPLTLGVPAMISNHLTYELCSFVCKRLRMTLVVIHINKCYCLENNLPKTLDWNPNYEKYQKKECGYPCPGNQHELCGNENTIVVFETSISIYFFGYGDREKFSISNPDFAYDRCIHLDSVKESKIYEFNLNNPSDIHPRYCLELCTSYRQKYALLNSIQCLCTNILIKKKQDILFTPRDSNCTQECPANYLYTCGNSKNASIYSVYFMKIKCPVDERRCLSVDISTKKNSFSTAQSYCKSIGAMVAKINDILDIQDILPMSVLNRNSYIEYRFSSIWRASNSTQYFWIDRTSEITNDNKTSDRSIGRCSKTSQLIDQHCILLRYEKIIIHDAVTYEQCFIESNECSLMSAIPVCVDRHLEFNPIVIPLSTNGDSSIISVNTTTDYTCGDDEEYHLMDEYCYKILFHEKTWQDAKSECERDKSMLFIPEQMATLHLIKFLFVRRRSYTSSGIVHVGVIYDNQNRTVIQYNTTNGNTLPNITSSNTIRTLCEKTFRERYETLMSSSTSSMKEKKRLKTQQTGCAYADFRAGVEVSISCDEIPCNQLATVICQKAPIRKMRAIVAKRSYRYMGCYINAFYNSYFISSYMEPTLCFRLCETPIIYIQASICRCSGGGLMDYNRQRDKFCRIACPKPGDRRFKSNNTCGGLGTYSVYVEEHFYTQHAELFNYQIQFASCQLWNSSSYYDTFQVKIDESSVKSSLNRLERCAVACLDQNTTTKSIAFNDDINQCLCIMPQKLNVDSNRALNLTILSNNNCDRYCDNILGHSKVEHTFKCGSSSDRRVWAIYDLNEACPISSVYIKELKKCISSEITIVDFCEPPSVKYVYDGNVTWNVFLKIIEKLNLTKSMVSIDFNNDVTIDPSWKCSTTTTSINSINLYLPGADYSNMNFSTNYALDNGCLRVVSYFSYLDRLSYRLCVENPTNKNSLSYDARFYPTYIYNIDLMLTTCPHNWLDLNKHCYQISSEPKTIQEARNSCITISKTEETIKDVEIIYSDSDDNDKNEMHNNIKDYFYDLHKGEIIQYTSPWQMRLGFYLLDTNLSKTESTFHQLSSFSTDEPSLVSNVNFNHSSIHEFQMINPTQANKSTIIDDSCIVVTRFLVNRNEISILKKIQVTNCLKPRHVLCKTKSIFLYSQQRCLSKPLILGLPTIISNHLTHELCLSVCKKLHTALAVIYINKCYCINSVVSRAFVIEPHYEKYEKKDCGNPCPGSQHELCGNEDTIVVFEDPNSIFQFNDDDIDSLTTPSFYFVYDSCIYLHSVNQSTMYEFELTRINDIHPRYCLELCTNYRQKYALLNSNKCLCTNIPLKKKQNNAFESSDLNCTQECSGNYLYTCGNSENSSIYSMYIMKTNCPADKQRCAHTNVSIKKNSFSSAQSYCKSIGGMVAKINDILEIQDILPKSMFTSDVFDTFSFGFRSRMFNDTKFFWIDRTSDITNDNKTSDRSIGRCSKTSQVIDPHCILLRYEKIIIHDTMTYEWCFTESNECSSISAIPVCVDQDLDFNSIVIPRTTGDDSSIVSINISSDYSCGDDTQYDLMDDYCYKVDLHETTWQDAKAKCERDNATLFIPERMTTLTLIKSLFLRQYSYTSSGVAHVGAFYDNRNLTIIQYNTTDRSTLPSVSDFNSLYTLCELTFRQRYERLMSSPTISEMEKKQLITQQTGCAYVDFRSDYTLSILCDEIPCNRLASMICQKLPIRKMRAIIAKRLVVHRI
ncbi:unnamed protein product [Rotaria sp. Silwood2]|nr:unnamed protein product [Rotaria sp. Silwood2]